jgi:hypothetical protein
MPFAVGPHDGLLVELLLLPVNVVVAATTDLRRRGVRRSPGEHHHHHHHHHRRPVALGVVDLAAKVQGPGVDVHHQRLWSSADHVMTDGRRQRDALMEAKHRLRCGSARGPRRSQRLLQRSRIGAGIDEEM